MYVVVVYDSNSKERKDIRAVLMPHLHWVQNSVFAGEMTRTAALDLYDALRSVVVEARVVFWLFDRKPETLYIGLQDDRESIFI